VQRPQPPSGAPSRRRHGWLARAVTGSLGIALLLVAVLSTVHAGRTAAQDVLDSSLQGAADASATALQEYFERAGSLNLLLANDNALRVYAGANRSLPARRRRRRCPPPPGRRWPTSRS
jgi:hypothetical protein